MNPIYNECFLKDTEELFNSLLSIKWLSVQSLRKEYFMSSFDAKYQYVENGHEYNSKPFIPGVLKIMEDINEQYGYCLNVCFLNRYDSKIDSLGWHSDDSPIIDQSQPIVVLSLGSEREIWWKEQSYKGTIPDSNKQPLKNGSLFIMPSGFQDSMYHRIPKHDREISTRISLTFRSIFDEKFK